MFCFLFTQFARQRFFVMPAKLLFAKISQAKNHPDPKGGILTYTSSDCGCDLRPA
jgi:hypothetical protein